MTSGSSALETRGKTKLWSEVHLSDSLMRKQEILSPEALVASYIYLSMTQGIYYLMKILFTKFGSIFPSCRWLKKLAGKLLGWMEENFAYLTDLFWFQMV